MTYCIHGHSLADAYVTKKGTECRTCRRLAMQRYQARQRTGVVARPKPQQPKDPLDARIVTLQATIARVKDAKKVDVPLLKAYRLALLSLLRREQP